MPSTKYCTRGCRCRSAKMVFILLLLPVAVFYLSSIFEDSGGKEIEVQETNANNEQFRKIGNSEKHVEPIGPNQLPLNPLRSIIGNNQIVAPMGREKTQLAVREEQQVHAGDDVRSKCSSSVKCNSVSCATSVFAFCIVLVSFSCARNLHHLAKSLEIV